MFEELPSAVSIPFVVTLSVPAATASSLVLSLPLAPRRPRPSPFDLVAIPTGAPTSRAPSLIPAGHVEHQTIVPPIIPSARPVQLRRLQVVATSKAAFALARRQPDVVRPLRIETRHGLGTAQIISIAFGKKIQRDITHKSTQMRRSSMSTFCILKYALSRLRQHRINHFVYTVTTDLFSIFPLVKLDKGVLE